MKINSQAQFRMNIENFSSIEAHILIKSCDNEKVNFKTISSNIQNNIITNRKNKMTFAPDY